MLEKELIELSEMQLARSKEILQEIPILMEHSAYNTAINRAYYAAFHAMKAIEALDRYDSKKHSGVISYFRMKYVRTGVFPDELSEIIGELQEARADSDYNIIIRFNAEDAENYYQGAVRFCSVVEAYLKRQYAEDESSV